MEWHQKGLQIFKERAGKIRASIVSVAQQVKHPAPAAEMKFSLLWEPLLSVLGDATGRDFPSHWPYVVIYQQQMDLGWFTLFSVCQTGLLFKSMEQS